MGYKIIDLSDTIERKIYPQIHCVLPWIEIMPMFSEVPHYDPDGNLLDVALFEKSVCYDVYGEEEKLLGRKPKAWKVMEREAKRLRKKGFTGWEEKYDERTILRPKPTAFLAGNYYRILMDDHTGTHVDGRAHVVHGGIPAGEAPLEYFYGDGVRLDVRHRKPGEEITADDLKEACKKINYKIKPMDIVLIWTGTTDSTNKQGQEILRLLRLDPTRVEDIDRPPSQWLKGQWVPNPGPGREAIEWLSDQGVKVMAIDIFKSFERPFPCCMQDCIEKDVERTPAHAVEAEREVYFIEQGRNFDLLPKDYGFKVAAFPLKIMTTGAPLRLVAIIED